MPRYVVTGPAAVVLVEGRRTNLDRGAPVPASADHDHVRHLLDVGLIAEIEDALPGEPGEPGEPAKSLPARPAPKRR